jgi:hypothetical protein
MGMPNDCNNGILNGEWVYAGKTVGNDDTARPYYKGWNKDFDQWMYLFYDTEGCLISTIPGEKTWIVSIFQPNPVLDCAPLGPFAWVVSASSSTRLTPPSQGQWTYRNSCSGDLIVTYYDNFIENVTGDESKESKDWDICADEGELCWCQGRVIYGRKYADGRIATFDVMINRPSRFKDIEKGDFTVPCEFENVTSNRGYEAPPINVPHHCMCRRIPEGEEVVEFHPQSNGVQGDFCQTSKTSPATESSMVVPPQPCDSAHISVTWPAMRLNDKHHVFESDKFTVSGSPLRAVWDCHPEYSFNVPGEKVTTGRNNLFAAGFSLQPFITFNVSAHEGNLTIHRIDPMVLPTTATADITITCAVRLPPLQLQSAADNVGNVTGRWVNLCETVLTDNATSIYTFGREDNTPVINFARDGCTLFMDPCTIEDPLQNDACGGDVATVITTLQTTEPIVGVRGMFSQNGLIGYNNADDCFINSDVFSEMAGYGLKTPTLPYPNVLVHTNWDHNITGTQGVTVFGTPDTILYGGCAFGANFKIVNVLIAETVVPATNVLRMKCAQSAVTEKVVYDLNGLEVYILSPQDLVTPRSTPIADLSADTNTHAPSNANKSSKKGLAIGVTLTMLVFGCVGIVMLVVRKRGTLRSSTETQITELIVNGAVNLVASAFAHVFAHDRSNKDRSVQVVNERQLAGEHMHSWLADCHVSRRSVICGALVLALMGEKHAVASCE